jgi:NADPH:quinone reductase-like Zn-dependent oxidoreductase
LQLKLKWNVLFSLLAKALYACLQLPTPENPTSKSFPFLVWGGASSLGLFAIQLAKLSGAFVIATASPKNNALVKSYGADEIFDYHDESTPERIRMGYPNLEFCLDCISKGPTISQAMRAIGEAGGHVHIVLPPPEGLVAPREDVRFEFALIISVLGRSFPRNSYPTPSPSTLSHDRRLAHDWMNFDKGLAYPLILSGKVKPNPIKRWLGGLDEINAAIQYVQSGKVSGEKIAHILA